MTNNVDYRLYPSMLDSFVMMQNGYVSEEELLNRINKVKTERTEPLKRGCAFEYAVKEFTEGKNHQDNGTLCGYDTQSGEIFHFPYESVSEAAKHCMNGTWGDYVSCTIPVDDKQVELYGFLDNLNRDTVVDIKCKGSYTFPNFLSNLQHHVYMLALQSNDIDVRRFKYVINNNNEIYIEEYPFNAHLTYQRVTSVVRDFINYIELSSDKITENKLYGYRERKKLQEEAR